MEAMMTTNSGKPIGRWPAETRASALISDTYDLDSSHDFIGIVAAHNAYSRMAARRLTREVERSMQISGASRREIAKLFPVVPAQGHDDECLYYESVRVSAKLEERRRIVSSAPML